MLGLPEIVVILVIGLTRLIPLAIAVWAIVALRRLREGQDALRIKLEGIERLLERT